jgi:hypothetical protein
MIKKLIGDHIGDRDRIKDGDCIGDSIATI